MTTEDRPLLRPVEPFPVRDGENTFVVIRDPEELAGETLAVTPDMALLMMLLDGTRTVAQISVEFGRMIGDIVAIEDVRAMVRDLDERYLLDNLRSRERFRKMVDEYDRRPWRDAYHAGLSYPDNLADLALVMSDHFARAGGAPEAGGGSAGPAPRILLASGDPAPISRPTGPGPRGLVLPHIDLRQGGTCIARGYRELPVEVSGEPTLYVILGVAHQYAPNLFTMSKKDFRTPLGPARVDREAAARLEELYGAERLLGEYAHKREHSIEFQTVFLSWLHREGGEFRILPILCGPLVEEMMMEAEAEADEMSLPSVGGPSPSGGATILSLSGEPIASDAGATRQGDRESRLAAAGGTGGRPIDRPEVGEFIAALRTLLRERRGRVRVIASVDLSHVGPKFGDEREVDDLRAEIVRTADLRMLERVQAGDPEGFFDTFRPDRNARNVDAVTAVYTLLHALRDPEAEAAGAAPPSGRLLSYEQYREAQTASLVSYASLAID